MNVLAASAITLLATDTLILLGVTKVNIIVQFLQEKSCDDIKLPILSTLDSSKANRGPTS